jgi:hypothetical protein
VLVARTTARSIKANVCLADICWSGLSLGIKLDFFVQTYSKGLDVLVWT